MTEIIDVEKVEFPLRESSSLFWVTVQTAEDLLRAADLEGAGVVYRCEDRLYFMKGFMGVKYNA